MRKEEEKSEPTKTSEQKEKKEPSILEILKQEKEVTSHVVTLLVCVITWHVCLCAQLMAVYERDTLLKEVEQLKRSFDDTLLRLRHEKSYLEATVVAADLK